MTQPDILQSPDAIFWRNAILIVCFGAGGLATFAVILRLFACRAYAGKIRAEDTLMAISVLMMWGSAGGALMKAYNGIGIDADKLPEDYNTRLAVGSWIIPKFWSISMACAKISIIIFINRAVQLTRRVNGALFVVALSVYAYTGVVFFFTIFMCQPISFYWDKTKPNGTCVSNETYMVQNIATAIAALITDLGILIIPMPTILTLKLEARKKAAVVGVFGVGILICAVSLTRVIHFFKFDTNHLSTSTVLETLSTILENDLSIICGCAPQIASLFKSFRDSTPYGMGYSGSYNPYGIAFRYPKSVIKTTVSGRGPSSSYAASTWGRNSSEVELNGIEVHTAINQEISESKHHAKISHVSTV